MGGGNSKKAEQMKEKAAIELKERLRQ